VGGTVVGGIAVGGTSVGTAVAGACVAAGATVVAGAHAPKIMLLKTNRAINCNVIFFMFFSYIIAEYNLIDKLDFNLIDN
jgi:cyanophycinase-like exopeptidase